MLRQRETVVWVFVMPCVFFYFIGTVTGGFGGPGQRTEPLALATPEDAGFLADHLRERLVERGYVIAPDAVDGAGEPPERLSLHQYLLAYASDFHLLGASMLPHGVTWLTPQMQVASLDHAMWFHRPFRVDEWLLYACDSPTAQGARGLARGSIYNLDGALVASTAQEGLIRVLPPMTRD
jgi:hypothetical protein